MIFNTLYESVLRNELILVDGGLCHWHLRKDGQITIREIIVTPEKQYMGIGTRMLETLKNVKGAKSIFAKCPADLSSNNWYRSKGFNLEKKEVINDHKEMMHWRLILNNDDT